MSAAVEYRQYADECLKAIWLARVPEIRALLLSMANRWLEMAAQAEHGHQLSVQANLEPKQHKKPPVPSISRRTRARQAN
jgi:hypothetical protein